MAHGGGGGGWKDLANGALLQCVEAATLGMPFEVWKTRMGRFRTESTAQAFVKYVVKLLINIITNELTFKRMTILFEKFLIFIFVRKLFILLMRSLVCTRMVVLGHFGPV